jgi:Fe-S-cluster-containing hydrogenase component 2
MLGCSLYHDGVCSPAGARVMVTKDMARFEFDIRICRHCAEPDCLAACPTGAMALDDRTVVIIDDDVCIRCGSCADACPFAAISYHKAADRYLKCDLCAGHADGPVCVKLCPTGALTLIEEQD